MIYHLHLEDIVFGKDAFTNLKLNNYSIVLIYKYKENTLTHKELNLMNVHLGSPYVRISKLSLRLFLSMRLPLFFYLLQMKTTLLDVHRFPLSLRIPSQITIQA